MQNFFRGFKKLAGMTGTANTEADEFNTIYGLPVTVVPTNQPVSRSDASDVVFKLDSCELFSPPLDPCPLSSECSGKLS